MRKRFMSVFLSCVFVLSCVACGNSSNVVSNDGIESVDNVDSVSDETATKPLEDTTLEEAALENTAMERGTTMSLEKEGGIVINRNVDLGDVPMGEEGTWTVFVYLCATDLESAEKGGFATLDMQEMLNASTGKNVRFVIQTGGTKEWHNDIIGVSELGRYEICNGSMTKIEAQVDASMGDANTLADFLEWGVENYPAANMGVVFWDHGGGSIAGVCVDENWERDRLYLTEIDAALATVADKMTDKF